MEFHQAFRSHFGAEWTEVLDSAEKSFAYIAYNDTYFVISNLHPVENVPLEQFLGENELVRSLNIIIS